MARLKSSRQIDLPLGADALAFQKIDSDLQLPAYIEEPLHLSRPDATIAALRSIDWSFTDDDTRFLTHDVHPYPAKYIPQIPGNLISRLSARGELILDPFGGSGTTALEAIRLGRRALSVDANPVATLIGEVKTARLDKSALNELNVIHASLATEVTSLPHTPTTLLAKYEKHVPKIANREKWFPDSSCSELALIRSRLEKISSTTAKNIGLLTLSRITLKVSFQDSETRYKSTPRVIPVGHTLRLFLKELKAVQSEVEQTNAAIRYGVSKFITADIRDISKDVLSDNSADLVVTSPPYGNATDYHLYHRFRLLWLGHNPTSIGDIEIGSHLKHQREATGFDSYLSDLLSATQSIHRVLKAGRYAALVIGDSVYNAKTYDTAGLLAREVARDFDVREIIERRIHTTRRSFAAPARRATTEKILILRKAEKRLSVFLHPPAYRMWPYEEYLRSQEIKKLFPKSPAYTPAQPVSVRANPEQTGLAKRLVFTSAVEYPGGYREPTWQAMVENGSPNDFSTRKDPKYATHGIHPYKGKFYPQLAKSLINVADLQEGASILDGFCGCGTTVLESYLNGFRGYGVDMNPLAAKITRVKVGILDTDPDVFREAVQALIQEIRNAPSKIPDDYSEFQQECHAEIERWFPKSAIAKINWVLRAIRRVSGGIVCDFFEVVLSSIIRDVSHQDPNDLRIRYRKIKRRDADVFGEFIKHLEIQVSRVEQFWTIRGYAPSRFFEAQITAGDCRDPKSFELLGLKPASIDLVLTSPPYATALPYIDTDRLSLLTIMGISSTERRPLEHGLIGSREIVTSERRRLEGELAKSRDALPAEIVDFLIDLLHKIRESDGGFRKQNMPALLLRFFLDMRQVIENYHVQLKRGCEAMIVIGDNTTVVDNQDVLIPTAHFLEKIGEYVGFQPLDPISISVTTENLVHISNAITDNVVLRLKK